MERSMNEAAEMKQKAEARFKEYSDRLAQLDTELGKLKSDIAAAAEADKKQIVAEAEENARRLKRETESLIEQYSKQLSANVRREVVEAALVAAEQRLRAAITDTDQERLADGFKRRLQERP
jgi:F-type H+-transporting ATPase subunit b